MTEKLFDGDEVNALFKQVRCKAVAQVVNTDRLGYTGFFLAR
jgi:hypothetical protein